MATFKHILPSPVQSTLMRLGIAWILLIVSHFVFWITNKSLFQSVGWNEWMMAIWFDLITLALLYLPYYGLYLIPHPFQHKKIVRLSFKVLYHLITLSCLLLNFIDSAYFPYVQKRSTTDLFGSMLTGGEFMQLLPTFLGENWILLVVLVLMIIGLEWTYRKTEPEHKKPHYPKDFAWLIGFVAVFFLIGRGGIRPKPVGIVDAAHYTSPENAPFVLNTPFTMLKTIAIRGIQQKEYFSIEEEQKWFNPIRKSKPQNLLPDSTNVVILVLEGFGKEFVGACGAEVSYTPFLDSLMNESLRYTYGFANGKKSVEAIPAIIASIPSLMDESYIASPYGDNAINSIPGMLKPNGYSSAFFHGASNGSMRFDAFASIAHFDHYFGRKEYGNDEHFDGTWGIYDSHFNPWTAKKISELPEPFCALLFTLSSHHPYRIPEEFKGKIKHGDQPICGALSYADLSLRYFFETAKKQPWFNNTVFIITADHTPGSQTPLFSERTHMYRIPIGIYHPGGLIQKKEEKKIAQQLDIFPTVLDLLNIDTTYYSYGSSLLQDTERESIAYLEQHYYYFKGEYMLIFSSEKAQKLLNFTLTGKSSVDCTTKLPDFAHTSEMRLKAVLQRYHRDLVLNKTRVGHEAENSIYH